MRASIAVLGLSLGALAAPEAASPLIELYQPARLIQIAADEVVCKSPLHDYRFDRSSGEWKVVKAKRPPELSAGGGGDGEYRYVDAQRGAEYRFATGLGDDEVRLEVHREQDGKDVLLADLELYDRSMAAEAWYSTLGDSFPSESAFNRQVRLGGAEVTDVTDDGRFLWATLAYSRSGQSYGVGTLVRVDTLTGEVEVFHPSALETSSLTHVATAAFAVWLGTASRHGDSGFSSPTLGLVRFEPVSGRTVSFLPASSPILGRVITALEAEGDTLWMGTDEGICRYRIRQQDWTCWRLVPRVRVLGEVPVSDRPGGTPGRRLHRGHHEVRWVTADSLEIITGDSVQGWVRLGPREKLSERNPYADIHELYFSEDPGFDRRLLFQEPGGPPEQAAVVQRITLEKLPLRTADGWQMVKARAGWIARDGLSVIPELMRVEGNGDRRP